MAETQNALDRNSADTQIFIENDAILSLYGGVLKERKGINMPEVNLELKMSLSMHEETKGGITIPQIFGAPIDASYVTNFDYDVAGSSEIKVKIVPIPPPSMLETK